MAKKMLINALHPEESRVAIVDENGRLVDLDIEITGSEQMRGNIYKGVVLRVEPGLQAAFIDIGLKKPGFLQVGELHPDWWQWRDDVTEEQRKKRPRIQEVLRRGQELLVQVEKDERDMKGAALTSYISLPGRYMVIMPGSDSTGISRKVEGEGERKKLKEMVKEMTIPEGIGYIIRTEAVGRTLEELQKDLDSLVARYNEIVAQGKARKGPALIYQEHAVVIRTIRDYFSADIDEVLVDSKEVCKEAKEFFKEVMPSFEKRVKMHQEKRPIFSRYQIEEQIDQIYEKKVLLKSGGSLVIEPTEALVSIDVNSGKSTGERGVEDTAFKTNMEAAEEVARQLRLRDLGGLIVIDFIDMRDAKRIREVEKTLKDALKADKARVTVGRISQFGMLEMSRQRIKQTLEQGSILDCPHCSGRGKVKGVENMAISFLRKVHAAAAKGNAAEVHGGLPLEVAYYLLNRKKRDLAQIENDYDIEVTIKGKPSFLMNQLELDVIKREKHHEGHHDEKPGREKAAVSHTPAAEPVPAEAAEVLTVAEAPAEGEKKKRTRSRKKKGEAETPAPEAVMAPPEEPTAEPLPEAEETEETTAGEVHADEAEHGKKKRRRRRRKKGKSAEGGVTEETAAEAEETAPDHGEEGETAGEAAAPGDETQGAKKKKRRRRKRGGAKHHGEESGTLEEGASAPAPASEPVPAEMAPAPLAVVPADETPAPAPAKKRAPRKKAEKAPPAEPAAVEAATPPVEPAGEEKPKAAKPKKSPRRTAVAPEEAVTAAPVAAAAVESPAETAPAKAKKPRSRAKATAAAPAAEAAPVTEAPAAAVPAEKPKRARAPRKKKEPTE
jgi:ribonuclease E